MADAEAKPRRRGRRWLIALLVIATLCVIGGFVLRHYSRPEKLTALLVEQTRGLLGAELVLGGVAGFEFSPNLHLILPKPALKSADASATLLSAASLDVVVPWHTLWGDRVDIEHIQIEHPVLDLDALSKWLAARPASAAPPDVRFALRVRDGTIVSAGKTLAEGVSMEFANAGDLAAWLASIRSAHTSTPLLPPLVGNVEARSVQIGATRIEGLRVEVHDDDQPASAPAQKSQ